ncbi:MAG: hypothetical protein MJ252_30170 [archaeon]|nr:hypothetical protein [archaeon]
MKKVFIIFCLFASAYLMWDDEKDPYPYDPLKNDCYNYMTDTEDTMSYTKAGCLKVEMTGDRKGKCCWLKVINKDTGLPDADCFYNRDLDSEEAIADYWGDDPSWSTITVDCGNGPKAFNKCADFKTLLQNAMKQRQPS